MQTVQDFAAARDDGGNNGAKWNANTCKSSCQITTTIIPSPTLIVL